MSLKKRTFEVPKGAINSINVHKKLVLYICYKNAYGYIHKIVT